MSLLVLLDGGITNVEQVVSDSVSNNDQRPFVGVAPRVDTSSIKQSTIDLGALRNDTLRVSQSPFSIATLLYNLVTAVPSRYVNTKVYPFDTERILYPSKEFDLFVNVTKADIEKGPDSKVFLAAGISDTLKTTYSTSVGTMIANTIKLLESPRLVGVGSSDHSSTADTKSLLLQILSAYTSKTPGSAMFGTGLLDLSKAVENRAVSISTSLSAVLKSVDSKNLILSIQPSDLSKLIESRSLTINGALSDLVRFSQAITSGVGLLNTARSVETTPGAGVGRNDLATLKQQPIATGSGVQDTTSAKDSKTINITDLIHELTTAIQTLGFGSVVSDLETVSGSIGAGVGKTYIGRAIDDRFVGIGISDLTKLADSKSILANITISENEKLNDLGLTIYFTGGQNATVYDSINTADSTITAVSVLLADFARSPGFLSVASLLTNLLKAPDSDTLSLNTNAADTQRSFDSEVKVGTGLKADRTNTPSVLMTGTGLFDFSMNTDWKSVRVNTTSSDNEKSPETFNFGTLVSNPVATVDSKLAMTSVLKLDTASAVDSKFVAIFQLIGDLLRSTENLNYVIEYPDAGNQTRQVFDQVALRDTIKLAVGMLLSQVVRDVSSTDIGTVVKNTAAPKDSQSVRIDKFLGDIVSINETLNKAAAFNFVDKVGTTDTRSLNLTVFKNDIDRLVDTIPQPVRGVIVPIITDLVKSVESQVSWNKGKPVFILDVATVNEGSLKEKVDLLLQDSERVLTPLTIMPYSRVAALAMRFTGERLLKAGFKKEGLRILNALKGNIRG